MQQQGRPLDEGERELLAALERRLIDGARSGAGQTGHQTGVWFGHPTDENQSRVDGGAGTAATTRINMMRYSTPNLLLSSNFELLLRQQDRVSTHPINVLRSNGVPSGGRDSSRAHRRIERCGGGSWPATDLINWLKVDVSAIKKN